MTDGGLALGETLTPTLSLRGIGVVWWFLDSGFRRNDGRGAGMTDEGRVCRRSWARAELSS